MSYDVNEILFFLRTPKSRREIETAFNLSNSERYHALSWLEKGGYITVEPTTVPHRTGRVWMYLAKRGQNPRLEETVLYTSEVHLCQSPM